MKPTEEQLEEIRKVYTNSICVFGSVNPSLGAAINYWESIRPKSQIERTNQDLGYRLDTAERNLKFTTLLAESRERELEEALREIERLKALIPAPLTFGDPPKGRTWHNPENLTPEQVEVDKGYRLFLTGEEVASDCQLLCHGEWMASSGSKPYWTYRTRSPLPDPKPDKEEVERREFEAWAITQGFTKRELEAVYDYPLDGYWEAWKGKEGGV